MPVFVYKAMDARKRPASGVIEASTARDARMRLMEKDLYLMEIRPASSEEEGGRGGLGRRRKAAGLALMTRQFATLVRAGIPLAEALAALVDVVEDPRLQLVLRDLRENVTQGMSLAEALKRHPRWFGPFYVNMVEVGEESGNMDVVLVRLAEYLHKQAKVGTKVRNALTYPVLLLTVGGLVVTFLVAFIVPRITGVLAGSGRSLPAPTVILMGVSGFLSRFWWTLGLGAGALYALYRTAVATERGRYLRDAALLALPALGPLVRKSLVSRFSLSLSTLLKSGVPAVESLEVVRKTVGNKVLEEAVEGIHDNIIEGREISDIMRGSGVFPPLVGYMIAVGEESGRLEEMLEIINEYYDEEIDSATARFTSVLEPVMIIALAFIVGFVVLAVLLPIMEIGEIV